MSDYVKRLRDARNWFNNDGQCCGQVDSVGTCAAPACIFGEALKEFFLAADCIEAQASRIAELEAENADLSANQCLHNIHGGEAGNPYCPRIAKLEAALANARRDAMEEAAKKALIIASVLSDPSAQNALRSFAEAIRAALKGGEDE